MKKIKTYFKTSEALKSAVIACEQSGMISEENTLKCACGETQGYIIFDDKGNEISKMYLCESCYENAPYMERGE